ncbi:MAG: Dyp-type peroxidase [Pseudomonadota bacterium]
MAERFPEARRDVTSKSIDGITDLVVWAPIKEGFIDAFANVTYESRLRIVAGALHNVRASAREFETLRPFPDTAQRILSLLDFRIGVVDRDLVADHMPAGAAAAYRRPRKYMYLVATFDGPWEPYMRLIWRPLGTFLDLVLCNCEGYVPSTSSFEDYAAWVRANQLDSAIFYAASGLTVADTIYLSDLEQIQRETAPSKADLKIAKLTAKTPDMAAADEFRSDPRDGMRLALEGLNVLYKLVDYYPPPNAPGVSGEDGWYLLRASRDLLKGFDPATVPPDARTEYRSALEWFETQLPPLPAEARFPQPDRAQIQKGVLTGYDSEDTVITHGALMLVRVTDPARAHLFLQALAPLVRWEDDAAPPAHPDSGLDELYLNMAFTSLGLERLGVPEDQIKRFPKEFRQGLRERAATVGDQFDNHPRNWRLPARNWPPLRPGAPSRPPIELAEIDMLIQTRFSYRGLNDEDDPGFSDFAQAAEPIDRQAAKDAEAAAATHAASTSASDPAGALERFVIALKDQRAYESALHMFIDVLGRFAPLMGCQLIGVESMERQRARQEARDTKTPVPRMVSNRDHFGFRDGISEPVVKDKIDPDNPPNDVLPGDIVYGYHSTRGDLSLVGDDTDSLAFNGSFMVVRKIYQDVEAFNALLDGAPAETASLIVGRTADGVPLVDPSNEGDTFDYKADPAGEKCPLSAHIRLANPRSVVHGRREPKLMRRGMSYGRRYSPATREEDRGIVFIAYCSSLAEQYEVVQRWLNAGNATRVASSQNDPLTGVFPRVEKQVYRYVESVQDGAGGTAQAVRRLVLDAPLTRLNWGEYFFVPSKRALHRLAEAPKPPTSNRAEMGEAIIQQMERLPIRVQQEEWKRILEDYLTKDPTEHDLTPLVWEAIDARGGAYAIETGIAADLGQDTPFDRAILVTDEQEILKILGNAVPLVDGASPGPGCPFTSREHEARMDSHFGAIYVCFDEGQRYQREAYRTNQILLNYPRDKAVANGFACGRRVIARYKAAAEARAASTNAPAKFKLELVDQYIRYALAELCKGWFGIPDETYIRAGAWEWQPDVPVCPGYFLSPSRHSFYPRPTKPIRDFAELHGERLKVAATKYVDQHWDDPNGMPGYVAKQMHLHFRDQREGYATLTEDERKDMLRRNLIGIMIGALPPADAILRFAFFEWFYEETFWRHQADFLAAFDQSAGNIATAYSSTLEALKAAMCKRPAPDLLYRFAQADGLKIGNTVANSGDLIVMSLSAASQARLRSGDPNVSIVFGGDRKLTSPTARGTEPLHACPAQNMAMGAMIGIVAALFEAGRIQALPASLIVEISDWSPAARP